MASDDELRDDPVDIGEMIRQALHRGHGERDEFPVPPVESKTRPQGESPRNRDAMEQYLKDRGRYYRYQANELQGLRLKSIYLMRE